MGETPLHYAAVEPIAAALLAAEADPDLKHFTMTPLAAATLAGHDEVARLIHDHSTRSRAAQITEQMRTLGLRYQSETDTEFMLAGMEPVDDPQHLFESSRAERRVEPDFPRTIFEGWVKQVDANASSAQVHSRTADRFPSVDPHVPRSYPARAHLE